MSIDYPTKNAEVITMLKNGGYSERTLGDHRRCFEGIWKCLSLKNTRFSMEAALDWLERSKSSWSSDTYQRYRRALYRFEKYLNSGEISADSHCRNNYFAYHDADVSYIKLPPNYKTMYSDFYNATSKKRSKSAVDHYVVLSACVFWFE